MRNLTSFAFSEVRKSFSVEIFAFRAASWSAVRVVVSTPLPSPGSVAPALAPNRLSLWLPPRRFLWVNTKAWVPAGRELSTPSIQDCCWAMVLELLSELLALSALVV